MKKGKLKTLGLLFTTLLLLNCGSDDAAPATPPEVTVLSTTFSGFSLTWDKLGSSISIELSESEDFSTIAFTATFNGASAEISSLTIGTTYFLRAQYLPISSPFSTVQQVTTADLLAPTGLEVGNILGDSFTISWLAIEGVTYSLDIATDQSFNTLVEDYDALQLENNQILIEAPQQETTYYFRLRSVYNAQFSGYSETGSATTNDKLIFRIFSSAFLEGGKIPTTYTCSVATGTISPPIAWKNYPIGTQSFAITLIDLDFMQGYNHWVIFDISPDIVALAEGISGRSTPEGSVEGKNDLNRSGYFGPCPPEGESHRYVFRIYALDTKLNLDDETDETTFLNSINGHVLGETTLTANFN